MNRRIRVLVAEVAQDLRYGLRQWRLSPIFTATALIILAAGTGANVALFGLFNALVLRPLPVHAPDQLVAFSAFDPKHPDFANLAPLEALEPFRAGQTVFSDVAGSFFSSATVERDGAFAEVPIAFVDATYFDVLQVGPRVGRLISLDDVTRSARVAVMSDDEWQRHHARNPDVLGTAIRLHGQTFTIIGVAQPGFCALTTDTTAAFAMPITTARVLFANEGLGTDQPIPLQYGVGRLRRGVTLDQARAELQSLWPSIRQAVLPVNLKGAEREDFLSLQLSVQSAATGFSDTRDWYAGPLRLLASATAWLMIVVAANLAGLVLSRAMLRQDELAIRASLGAARGRLVRQWLTEGWLLAIAGTALGLPIAWRGAKVLATMLFSIWGPDPSFRLDLSPDWRMAAVVATSALITGTIVGLVPVWRATRRAPRAGWRSTLDLRTSRWVDGLLMGQIAVALVLVIGAVLFARSLSVLRHVNPGFRTDGTSFVGLALQPGHDPRVDAAAYLSTLHDRLMTIAGVKAVGFSDIAPAWGFAPGEEKQPVARADSMSAAEVEATFVAISPGYFGALDIPLRTGRDFTWADDSAHPRAAIVSARLAEALFGTRDPVGHFIRVARAPDMQRIPIVGVSADARLADLHTRDPLFVFLPILQAHDVTGRLPGAIEVRWTGAFGPLQPGIAREVQALGQEFVYEQITLREQIEHSLMRERLLALGGYGFGAMAIAIVVVGLFGLLASTVAARTRELAIRSALGATSRSLQWMVVRRAGLIAASGVAIGLPLAWSAGRWVRGILTDVSSHDATSVTLAVVALGAATVGAAWWPARRASRVDPIQALRTE
jgi:predicted permease